jgi:small subunit ribosomal protein S30
MKASFGWLLAQANYQGFTTYNDVTYPLATQTVITNGQLWSLYAYQLNTISMHNENIDENPKYNVCFGTKPMKLYDGIENGKVKGLNEDVLKMLVQFYLNAPEKREYNMKPYLGKEEQVVADIEDDNKRCWLENIYKHIASNRPKHLLSPEIYLWEKIYKIEHNTRPIERKTRPFEFGINPFKRRLNEHLPPYIPKALRPYPRSKKKFETTYYPDV